MKNTAIEFGSAIMGVLAPILVALADKIQAFTSWFSGLSEGTKKICLLYTSRCVSETGSEVWIESERLYEVLYEMEV